VKEARTEAIQRAGDQSSFHSHFDGFYLTRNHYSNNSSATANDAKNLPRMEKLSPWRPGHSTLTHLAIENSSVTSGASKNELSSSRSKHSYGILK